MESPALGINFDTWNAFLSGTTSTYGSAKSSITSFYVHAKDISHQDAECTRGKAKGMLGCHAANGA